MLNQIDLIDIYRTLPLKATSTQEHMEHSPGYTTSWDIYQTMENFRKLKYNQMYFPTTTL